jgi:thiol-disulfide isomerase/thioredoxin
MLPRSFGLIAVLILIVGSIAYLELEKNRPVLPVVPNEGEIPIEVAIENAAREVSSTEPTPAAADPREAPKNVAQGMTDTKKRIAAKSGKYPRVKDISSPDGFINVAEGFKLADIVGKKVILVDFWTYSCINCQRTTPYLNAWYEKYRNQGLEIVGIHTPEFEFEKNYDNVLDAVNDESITYPVVLDNDYSTWTAYQNRFWPRKYLIDIDGFIVYDHIGEGAYELTEKQIQLVLAERSLVLNLNQQIASGIAQPDMGVDTPPAGGPISPETYFGALRNANFGNGARGVVGEQSLTVPQNLVVSTLYLDGRWNMSGEYAENLTAGAKIVFRYQAKNVYMVASADSPVTLRILRDGQPIGTAAGEDVKNGTVIVQEDKLYKLVNENTPGEHTLEIIIESPGLKAFTFTFG